MENSISVIIQVRNEEKHIKECIQSAKLLTSDILVIDTESTDKTVDIAQQAGAVVKTFPNSQYVEPARQFGIEQATGNWVFILDADERMTPELAEEIKKVIPETKNSYFKVPRQNIFANKKWLQHGGWWPDMQMRLIKKVDFVTWPSRIHSTPEIKGTEGRLDKPFKHLFHGDIEQMVKKTAVYEGIEVDLLFKANRSVNVGIFFRKFFGELYRRLVKNQGYADGDLGIIESIYQAFSKTITYLFLYEKKNSRSV
jgi:glycosyltransferase involved in cell wall biosynthesis